MPSDLARLFLVRHGATAWSDSGQHTGRTDLPLNEKGRERARQLGGPLRRLSFAAVFTSPLQRAATTCALAGFAEVAVKDPDLLEWNYGRYEGKTTKEILAERPGWEIYRDGCPEGESPQNVATRADRFIQRARGIDGDVLVFSSAHIIRMIAARWLEMPPGAGRCFISRPASVGVLAFEHNNRDEPVIGLWNWIADVLE
jgi:broad specificity phosphatase PhoE